MNIVNKHKNIKSKIKFIFKKYPYECFDEYNSTDNFNKFYIKEYLNNEEENKFLKKNNKEKFDYQKFYKRKKEDQSLKIFNIKNGCILGNSNIVTNSNFEAALISITFSYKHNKVFKNENFIDCKNGDYIYEFSKLIKYTKAIFIGSNPNFGHFMFNHLAKLCLIDHDLSRLPIIIGEDTPKRFLECLKYFNFNKIILAQKSKVLMIDDLYVPQMPWFSEDRKGYWSPNITNELRKKFKISNKKRLTKNLILSRKNATHRKICNEDKIFEYLNKNYNFELFEPENFTMKEQIEIAKNVKTMIQAPIITKRLRFLFNHILLFIYNSF